MSGINLEYLKHWYEQPLGIAFTQMQQAEINAISNRFRGQRILQLGVYSGLDCQLVAPTLYSVSAASDVELKFSGPFVATSYQALPFLSDSIDVVFINYVLEFESNLELIFEEIWRILAGGGQVVVMGFNAFSLWGLAHLFKRKQIPWNGHFYTAFQIQNFLSKVGFTVTLNKTFFFRPPVQNTTLLARLKCLEKYGELLFAPFGAGYLLLGEKSVLGTTPLRSRWEFSELLADRAMKPVARV